MPADRPIGSWSNTERSERARHHVQKNFQQINLDAQRTGGSASSTAPISNVDRGKVAAILEAWTCLNPAIHYTQGLNEVAATLLRRHNGDVSEATAELKWLTTPNTLGALWSGDMPLYEAGRKELRLLVDNRLPALHAKLQDVGLDDSAYLPQAWHSLFAKWLPPELAAAAVDDLLEHGMASVLAITLTVLETVEGKILEALNEPEAGLEALVGPCGCFCRLQDLLAESESSLQAQWQALQVAEDVCAAGLLCIQQASNSDHYGSEDHLSRSFGEMVHQEAVLRLAEQSTRRYDDQQLIEVFHHCMAAQDKATRDELHGDHRYVFKCAVVGNSNVGKSRLVSRGANSVASLASASTSPTVGIDVASKRMKIHRQRVNLHLYDLSGRIDALSVTRCYINDIAAVFFVYDVCCRASFQGVVNWRTEVLQNCDNSDLLEFLVGNKVDLAQRRQVPEVEARQFADQHRMVLFECSGLRGDNVDSLIEQAATKILERNNLSQASRGVPLRGVKPIRRSSVTGDGDGDNMPADSRSFLGRLEACRRATCNIM